MNFPKISEIRAFLTSKGCRAWWARWSSAFVATVCGIVFTLGTNFWVQGNAKEAKQRRALEMALLTMHDNNYRLQESYQDVLFADSVFNVVMHQNDVDSLEEETCKLFYMVMSYELTDTDLRQAAKGLYSNSFDFWQTVDNPAAMEAMGRALEIEDLTWKTIDKNQAELERIFYELSTEKWKYDYPSVMDLTRAWLADPRVKLFNLRQKSYLASMELMLEERDDLLKFLREELDISEDRLCEISTTYQQQRSFAIELDSVGATIDQKDHKRK
ncbi:MAG: hypothetical protein LIP02_00425 [Bacteroidales bacterium]|nr:hypothetical protein [Bacteroidales bacterium]